MKLVTLVMDHWHEGVYHKAGETIELPDDKAAWLCQTVVDTRVAERKAVEDFKKKYGIEE